MKSNFSFLIIASLALVVSSCDQTLDEYHQAKVNQNLTRLKGISGKYVGSLTNDSTQAAMGTIEIDLDAALIPVDSSDSSQMTTEAALTGTVIVNSAGLQGSAKITNLAYGGLDSSKSGAISGNISIPLSDGTQAVLAISGTLDNGTITGQIGAGNGGTSAKVVQTADFSASLIGGSSTGQSLSAIGSAPRKLEHDYQGTIAGHVVSDKDKPGTRTADKPVILAVRPLSSNPAELLFDAFSSQQNMNVSLIFVRKDSVTGVTETVATVNFSTATLDVFGATLAATGPYNGDVNTSSALNCAQGRGNQKYDPAASWSCTFSTGQNQGGQTFVVAAQN